MLNEDQVTQLVSRCEAGVGHALVAIRGSLATANNRAAAIWEMIVLDAVLALGAVEYERPVGGSSSSTMDFYLHVGERGLWIDATYLTGRFIDNERRSDSLVRRFGQEGKKRGVPDRCLWLRTDGDPADDGFRRRLPAQHELAQFFRDPRVEEFFTTIKANPSASTVCDMRPDHTVTFGYDPTGKTLSGGLVEEAPRSVKSHAIYRKLKEKAGQHRGVPGPYVVCLGGDRSPVMRRLQAAVPAEQAVRAAFARWPHLSAVVLVSIEAQVVVFEGMSYRARSSRHLNPRASCPLAPGHLEMLTRLDFNRWRYSRPHDPWKPSKIESESRRHSGGHLSWRQLSNGNVELEIPTWLLADALRGPENVIEAFALKEDDQARRVLTPDWEIVSARFVEGDIIHGDPPRVALQFRPAGRVFQPPRPQAG